MKKINLIKFVFSVFGGFLLLSSCTDDGFQEFTPPTGNVNGIEPNTFFTTTTDGDDLTYIFRSFSTDAASYSWDFGDGNTSTAANANHTYDEGGLYTIILETVSSDGLTAVDSMQVAPVTAGFEIESIEDSQVTFLNTSSGGESYSWDFGDGNTSEEESPVHTYTSDDDFVVTLTTTGSTTEDFETGDTIDGNEVSTSSSVTGLVLSTVPAFTFETNDLEVTFTDQSTNAASYLWDFGDGNTSTDASPIHTYAEPGEYDVVLETTNSAGVSRETNPQTIAVGVTLSNANFAFITNNSTDDTGELRLVLDNVIEVGMMTATISKNPSDNANYDAFINLSGSGSSNTSRANAMIDLRIDDSNGYSFTQSGDSVNATANFPEFNNDQDVEVVITWDASGDGVPLVTFTIDGQAVTEEAFSTESASLANVGDGVEVVQFRIGGSSDIDTTGAGFSVDNLMVYDTSSGSSVLVFEDDFEDYTVGNSLDPNATDAVIEPTTPYNNNSFQVTVDQY